VTNRIHRVLVVHNYYEHVGGEDITFASEKKLLAQHGVEIVEYTDSNEKLNYLPAHSAAIGAIWSRDSYHSLLKLIDEERPDIAHFHNTFLAISPSAYYACQARNLPVIQTIHNYRLACPVAILYRDGKVCEDCCGRIFAWPAVLHGCYRDSRPQSLVVASMLAYHWSRGTWLKQVDAYIALTNFSREKLIALGIPPGKIFQKPVFVESETDAPHAAGEFVLFVGRLSADKGVSVMLAAFSKLKTISIKIAGDGPLRREVEDYSHSFPHIQYLGFQNHNDISNLMQNARFMVFPSVWYEVSPRTIMEAYSHSLPIVASRLGAMTELVRDGETGLLFEPGNHHDLAEKVAWLWTHPQEALRMGKNARQVYEEKYTPEHNYQMLMEIYSKVLENKQNNESH
jgi:glycosyltransferase involved in cell wall biosynthesis